MSFNYKSNQSCQNTPNGFETAAVRNFKHYKVIEYKKERDCNSILLKNFCHLIF